MPPNNAAPVPLSAVPIAELLTWVDTGDAMAKELARRINIMRSTATQVLAERRTAYEEVDRLEMAVLRLRTELDRAYAENDKLRGQNHGV